MPQAPSGAGGGRDPPRLAASCAWWEASREQYLCLHWLVSLLIVLKRRVLGWTALLQALSKVVQVVKGVTPLSPPPTTKPFTPYSPYDARPGIPRFRGTPTAPETPSPSLSLSLSLSRICMRRLAHAAGTRSCRRLGGCPLSGEAGTTQNVKGGSPGRRGLNLALTVLGLPYSLDSSVVVGLRMRLVTC